MRVLSDQEVQAVSGGAEGFTNANPLLAILAAPFAAIFMTGFFNALGGSTNYFGVLGGALAGVIGPFFGRYP